MKKLISFLLSLIVILSSFSFNLAAEDFVAITFSTNATVVQVIDGDAIMVRLPNGNTALVRLIGVDTMGYTPAYEYMYKELMGSSVYLMTDTAFWTPVNRWNKMYVYKSNQLINSKLLAGGFGKINPEDANASLYRTLLNDEATARYNKIGIWNEGYTSGSYAYKGKKVNINTASQEQLKDILNVNNNTLPNNIVRYRDRHPFETVAELKFVSGMTKEIYDESYMKLTVATNVRTAPLDELVTLHGVNDAMAQDIINYRSKYRISNLRDLYSEDIMPRSVYDNNLPFMSLSDTDWIAYAIPDYTVNVVTATQDQLEHAGLSSTQAKRIVDNRTDYTVKSLYDLKGFESMNFSELNINYLADNLHVYTELNKATEYEIRSLFGKNFDRATFDKILDNRPYSDVESLKYYINYDYYLKLSPYLYVDKISMDYVNLNTATTYQLTAAGFSQTQADTIYRNRGKMFTAKDIPVNVGNMDKSVSLYTNVNTASFKELESLSPYMNASLVNLIILYRDDQPFGSLEEIREFFVDQGSIVTFNQFEEFIVIR